MLKTQKSEFEKFLSFLKNGINFGLARYADGERLFIEGKQSTGIDGWTSPPYVGKLGRDLSKALEIASLEKCYIGISDDENDLSSKLFYTNLLSNTDSEFFTLSNVFVNGTYQDFIDKLLPILTLGIKDLTIVCNYKCGWRNPEVFPPNSKYIYSPSNCSEFWERSSEKWLSFLLELNKSETNSIYLFAAGPISSVTIPHLWKSNKQNTYIDIGSALDLYLHGKYTRPYQITSSPDNKQLSTLSI